MFLSRPKIRRYLFIALIWLFFGGIFFITQLSPASAAPLTDTEHCPRTCNIRLGMPLITARCGRVNCVGGLEDYLNVLYEMLIELAGLAAVAVIVYSGIRMITSEGDPNAIQEGKDRITSAVVGFALLILAALIVEFVRVS